MLPGNFVIAHFPCFSKIKQIKVRKVPFWKGNMARMCDH